MAVTNDQNPQLKADSQHDKPIFVFRMIRIKEPNGVFIKEHRSSFFKANAVLASVQPVLGLVPLETNFLHMYNVHTS